MLLCDKPVVVGRADGEAIAKHGTHVDSLRGREVGRVFHFVAGKARQLAGRCLAPHLAAGGKRLAVGGKQGH